MSTDISISNKNEYLRFSASSIKELLQQKLSEGTNFTDQAFAGSVIDIMLDSLSQMYAAQMFYLNNSAAESIFTDSSLYENMNRIVKMLAYNPRGYITSSLPVRLTTTDKYSDDARNVLHRYTTVTTNLKTSSFKTEPITYSCAFDLDRGFSFSTESPNELVLYNGSWNLYPQKTVSLGVPFETVILNKLDISEDSQKRDFISHDHIDVFVQTSPTSLTYEKYSTVNTLFESGSQDLHVEVRLNENKNYQLRFGDGVKGRRIPKNCDIRVIYLKSNGAEGVVGPEAFPTAEPLTLKWGVTGLTISELRNMLDVSDRDYNLINSATHLGATSIVTDTSATESSEFETVADIRTNAPNWFRMGSRLITYTDFEQFIKGTFSQVRDVTVHNNWDFLIEFEEWLRTYDKLSMAIRQSFYKFADAADANNIYIWIKNLTNIDNKRAIEEACNRIKSLTAELIVLDPVHTFYSPLITKHNLDYVTSDTFYDELEADDQNIFDQDQSDKIDQVEDRFGYIFIDKDEQITEIVDDVEITRSRTQAEMAALTDFIPIRSLDTYAPIQTGNEASDNAANLNIRRDIKMFIFSNYEPKRDKLIAGNDSWERDLKTRILNGQADIESEVIEISEQVYTYGVYFPTSTVWEHSQQVNIAKIEVLRNMFVTFDQVDAALKQQYADRVNNYRNGLYMDAVNSSYLEITRNKHSLITTERIRKQVGDILINYFRVVNSNLGMKIDIDQIHTNILAIDGVNKVRTITLEQGDQGKIRKNEFDGISFGAWTDELVDKRDKRNVSANEKIKDFQFPVLYFATQIDNIIRVEQDDYLVTGVEY
jgi:hypothetical protein